MKRVYIEISNICNLQCSFCPEVERPKKVMPFELFEILTAQVRGLTDEITFHQMGEPLTHPQFEKFVEHCEKIQLPVNLTTNGTMLKHRKRMETLLSPAFRQVNFSLQSYSDNFPAKDIREYLRPIFDFTRLALERRPDLYINYRLWNMGSEEDTVLHNAHFLQPISEEFGYQLNGKVDVAHRKSRNITGRLYLHFDSRFEWPSSTRPIRSSRGTCYALIDHIAIQADGTVVPCCLDKEAGICLGNVNETGTTVFDIINADRARSMRKGFESFELREDLCQRCSFISRFDRKRSPNPISE